MDEQVISFGPFRLLAPQRLLLEGDQPVRLGSRALDLLAVLAENAGRLVPKEELIARVWPNVYGRFTEGFATADLRAAEALLAQLG
jgi:DNA-binding winged helix-turn-helix (wHTH) protein